LIQGKQRSQKEEQRNKMTILTRQIQDQSVYAKEKTPQP